MVLFTDGFKLLKKASEPLHKTPKYIQETIEIMAVAENGIFERYCKFLNSLDCNYKIIIVIPILIFQGDTDMMLPSTRP